MTAGRLLNARRFEFQYGITIAPHDEVMSVWIPMPSSDEHQTISDFRVELADSQRMLISECQGNRILFVELPRSPRERRIRLVFSVERRSRTCRQLAPGVDAPACNASAFLGSDRRVPVEGEFARQAKAVVSEQMSAWEKARTLFDHVLATYSYDPSGCTPAKGDAVGDLQVACDLKLGTCTDLHGVLVASLRAVGVPARFAFGFNIACKAEGRIAGYHCWAEAYLPRFGWVAMDVSEARKREPGPERDFYFGNLDENRIQFSMDRDLALSPPPHVGRVDKLIFPLCESSRGGCGIVPEFSFLELSPSAA